VWGRRIGAYLSLRAEHHITVKNMALVRYDTKESPRAHLAACRSLDKPGGPLVTGVNCYYYPKFKK